MATSRERRLNTLQVGFRLALQDISDRYRRSTFGPFWITLSQLAFVFAVGTLYAKILGQSFRPYLHFLACGVLLWQFFAGVVADTASSLVEGRELLLNTSASPVVILIRALLRQVITFGHSLPVLLLTALIAQPVPHTNIALSVLGVLLLAANAACIGAALAIVSVRFRDVPLMLVPILQFLFIVSPIIWKRTEATAKNPLVAFNVVGMWIDAARAPLVGDDATRYLAMSAGTLVVGVLCTLALYRRFEHRIAYWL
jgi:ABC-type polysaccharide/polyol phosphate export permease